MKTAPEIKSIYNRVEDFKKPLQQKMEKEVMKKLVYELQYYTCSFESHYLTDIIKDIHLQMRCCICNDNPNYYLLINGKYLHLYMCFRCKHSFEEKVKKRKYQNAKEILL